jgi:hypothetical protein
MSIRPWWLLPTGRIHPGWWVALGGLLLWLDHLIGPNATFPVIYTLPVILAAWYSGKWAAIGLAVAFPLVRIATFFLSPGAATEAAPFVLATLFRGSVVVVMALWFARMADHERELSRQVRVLEGLLSICAFCKSIRNEGGKWETLESYISRRSEAEFSHGVCPSCGAANYPGLLDADERVSKR